MKCKSICAIFTSSQCAILLSRVMARAAVERNSASQQVTLQAANHAAHV